MSSPAPAEADSDGGAVRARWVGPVGLVVGVAVLMLILGWFGKVSCIGPTYDANGISTAFEAHKNTYLCYSDIQQLWPQRGISDHVFPYVHGSLLGENLLNGAIEYPVLTGLFVWLTALFAHTDGQFLAISAVFLAPFGVITAWLLAKLTGRRALIWAAAPALIFYGYLNWDLLVCASFAAAVWAWWRGRPVAAAAWLAVGAALKLYPAMFVFPLILERLAARDRRGAVRVALTAGGLWLLINLPFLLINPHGWWATYAFQKERHAGITTNSIWFWGFGGISTGTLNWLTPILILVAWAGALGYGWRRTRGGEHYPWIQVSGAMLCGFLLLNKVHSPQYLLWLLPFFVLIRVRWGWWVSYWVFDALLFAGLFEWYGVLTAGGDEGLAKEAAVLGVWGRAVMLVLLYVVFLVSPLAVRARGGATDADRSGAPSSTPPVGSSTPVARTTSRPGRSTSRTTSTQ